VNPNFLGSADLPLDLFHYLGKILYAKRQDASNPKWKAIEQKLNENVKPEYRRALPPKEDLTWLTVASPLPGNTVS
jgi:hypothetical protein